VIYLAIVDLEFQTDEARKDGSSASFGSYWGWCFARFSRRDGERNDVGAFPDRAPEKGKCLAHFAVIKQS